MGFKHLPRGVPPERLKYCSIRTKESARVEGLENEMEWYYTDTGEAVPEEPEKPGRTERAPGTKDG